MCNAVSSGHLPLSSSEVNERKRKLSLRCLLVLKYALEVELDSSVPEDTGRKKKYASNHDKKSKSGLVSVHTKPGEFENVTLFLRMMIWHY